MCVWGGGGGGPNLHIGSSHSALNRQNPYIHLIWLQQEKCLHYRQQIICIIWGKGDIAHTKQQTNKQNKLKNKQNLLCKKKMVVAGYISISVSQSTNLFSFKKKVNIHELITQDLINFNVLYKIIDVAEMASYIPFDVSTSGFIWRQK